MSNCFNSLHLEAVETAASNKARQKSGAHLLPVCNIKLSPSPWTYPFPSSIVRAFAVIANNHRSQELINVRQAFTA